MSTGTTGTATKPKAPASTKVQALIKRPELTSLLGAVIIFAVFMVVAPAFRSLDAFATVLYASSTIGIMAVAVGLSLRRSSP